MRITLNKKFIIDARQSPTEIDRYLLGSTLAENSKFEISSTKSCIHLWFAPIICLVECFGDPTIHGSIRKSFKNIREQRFPVQKGVIRKQHVDLSCDIF